MDPYLFAFALIALGVFAFLSSRGLQVVVLAYQAKVALAQKMAALARKKAAQMRKKGGKRQEDDEDEAEGFLAGFLDSLGVDAEDLVNGDPQALQQLQDALAKLPKPNGAAAPPPITYL